MTEKSSWESFFDAHAAVYEENVFTKETVREVDFVLEELSLQPGASILGMGCGTGRHSVELAKRGFAVTGLDLSSGMLAKAAAAAKAASVNVRWIHTGRDSGEPGEKGTRLDEIEIMILARKTGEPIRLESRTDE